MNPKKNALENLKSALEGVDSDEAARMTEVWDLLDEDPEESIPTPETIIRARAALLGAMDGRLDTGDPNAMKGRDATDNHTDVGRGVRGSDRPARRRASLRRRTMLWPVAIVLLIGAIALAWSIDPISVRAPLGERSVVTLPDGSTVELNSGSSIYYARRFGAFGFDRVVRLDGEAYFDVVSGSSSFVVKTYHARVTVIGTRFNVRSWRDQEESSTVTVEEGRVRVDPESGEGTIVAAGSSVRVTNVAAQADSVALSLSDATAWRRGDLVFKGRMVGVILADVKRRFDVNVEIDRSVAETTRLHLVLRAPLDAETVVRDLAGALNLRYRERSDGFELHDPGP